MCDLCFLVLSSTILLLKTGFFGSSAGKESACNAGDPGSIPGSGRSAGEGKGYRLQDSGLENSMDCLVHGIPKSWTQLASFYQSLPVYPRQSPLYFLSPRKVMLHSICRYCLTYST